MKFMKYFYRFLAIVLICTASDCNGDEVEVYGVGVVVDVGFDQTMVLNSAEFQEDRLVATFTVKNNGAEESNYNLWMSLQARDPEGHPFGQIIGCGGDMEGTLAPGEEGTGTICWDHENNEVVTIHYIVLLMETDIIWEVRQ